ncbi:MBL fold metallo-hydrolase [Dehalococcoidia bacterium]|nr:MBL fold metallo-hydrolase [Dehalococcoidia bacterium]
MILLGTGGGPKIWAARSQPSSALVLGENIYIVDAGDGVTNQLALSRLNPLSIKAVFITHNHSDHVAGFGNLLLRSWQSGHNGPIKCFGPSPLVHMAKSYRAYMNWDIQLRIRDEGRPDLGSVIDVKELSRINPFFTDEEVTVSYIKVPHGAAEPSYAYRFDFSSKSIVFSGDTSRSEALAQFAKGADILVHEVLNRDGVDAIVRRTYPGNESFRKHILESHTSMHEVGEIATKAGVGILVLNHFVPTGSTELDKPEVWIEGVSQTYKGSIIAGEDLQEIPL